MRFQVGSDVNVHSTGCAIKTCVVNPGQHIYASALKIVLAHMHNNLKIALTSLPN